MASSKILGKPYSKEDLPAGRYEERSEEFSCPSMKNKIIIFGAMFGAGISFLVFLVIFFRQAVAQPPLPRLGHVADFQLLDTRGKEFGLKDLKGKVWVADFIFTTCGSICPLMTKNMAALQRSYHLVDDAAFVSISVNPEYDSPEILAQFAKQFAADTNQWHFLTGPREAITNLAVKSFKVGSVEEPIFHSAHFVLVDRQGSIRGYYEGTQTSDIEKIFKGIAQLLRER